MLFLLLLLLQLSYDISREIDYRWSDLNWLDTNWPAQKSDWIVTDRKSPSRKPTQWQPRRNIDWFLIGFLKQEMNGWLTRWMKHLAEAAIWPETRRKRLRDWGSNRGGWIIVRNIPAWQLRDLFVSTFPSRKRNCAFVGRRFTLPPSLFLPRFLFAFKSVKWILASEAKCWLY